MEEEFEVVIKE
ncbi:Protein of unknown function [Bacillus mycoides]|nr:Protein of unknown function [Bacillus mycoides]SCM89238.1 Protein of unknown function [Bacillus mycoides]